MSYRSTCIRDAFIEDMIIEDYRAKSDIPPTSVEMKNINRLWNERQKIVKQICKVDNKEKTLLSGKIKKKNERER